MAPQGKLLGPGGWVVMLKKNLVSLLGALMLILWTGQSGQTQSTPEMPMQKKTCANLWPVEQDNKWGYIDKTGRLIIPCKFDSAGDFSEGLAAVEIKEKTGYIDETGKFVIQPRFLSGFSFSDGLAVVVIRHFKKDKLHMHQYAYIDKSGKIVIRPREALDSKSFHVSMSFKQLDFSEGLLPVVQKNGTGYIDKAGKQVIPPKYHDAHPFSEGLAAVKFEDKYGYIDRSGKMVIPPQFDSADSFSEGLAVAYKGDQGGYIDKSGKQVIDGAKFISARGFSEGLAAVGGENEKYGFIDKTGKFVIQPQFSRVGDFSEGLAAVEQVDVGWPNDLAYINQTGEMVIKSMSSFPNSPMKTEFDLHLYRFCGGVALVGLGENQPGPFYDDAGYINKEGKFIWPKVTPSKKE
jgi:hypothetical protein